jgi:hypothetical protein
MATDTRLYSVVITNKGSLDHDVYLDISEQFLEKHVVEPYREGRPLDMLAKSYVPGDIAGLKIYEQGTHSDNQRSLAGIMRGSGSVSDLGIAESGTDVTDQVLGAPRST